MRPNSTHLIALWATEQVVDGLLAERADLDVAIENAEGVLGQAESTVAGIEAELLQLKEQEHTHSRRLHTYAKKRDETRELIDTGRAPDFQVAERQYEKCAAIADEAETNLLEIMETQDETAERKSGAVNVRDLKIHALEGCRDIKSQRMPGLQEELSVAVEARDAARSPVPTHLLGRYDQLRKKGLSCVAPVKDGSCTGCRMAHNRTAFAEHKRGAAVHHCTNCGRFLGALV